MSRILITGAAGFIGFHVARRLLERGEGQVVGLDCLSSYYSTALKRQRLALLEQFDKFEFVRMDLADRAAVTDLQHHFEFTECIHLAAQAGVRYSLENPATYVDCNLVGFANLLELARHGQWRHLVFASSSSVYGANNKVPFSTSDPVDHPLNLYAATKKANELMAHAYSHLFRVPVTGVRFFTVYGPWGRPDMAVWRFTEAIDAGEPIDIYNLGQMERDFTYIDDIVDGVLNITERPPSQMNQDSAPYRIYNLGNNHPHSLDKLVGTIELALRKKAVRNLLPQQPGDMLRTFADIGTAQADHGFDPQTPLEDGIPKFVDWYREWSKPTELA